MLKKIVAAGLVAGGLLAVAFTATSAVAARMGGMQGGMPGPGAHAASQAPAPSGNFGPAAHAPRGAMNHPGPGPGPGAGGRVYGWQGSPHHHVHHRRGFGVIVGSGYYDGDYGYEYAGGCEWLHERAIETGSRYWWHRYEDCIEG